MPKRKNILVITCDHLRADALGCMGNPLAVTPNLDRLAANSLRFTNCYSQSPVCAPARYSMATGRYVHAHGVHMNEEHPYPGLYTIAHALKDEGYRRFNVGHMHWTDTAGTPPDFDTGYERWVTMNDWRATLSPEALRRFDWEHGDFARRTIGGPSTRTPEEYWGHHVAEHTIAFLESAASQDEPFLCWSSFYEPHPPFQPPKSFYERIDQSTIELPSSADAEHGGLPPYVAQKQGEWAHLTPPSLTTRLRQFLARN